MLLAFNVPFDQISALFRHRIRRSHDVPIEALVSQRPQTSISRNLDQSLTLRHGRGR